MVSQASEGERGQLGQLFDTVGWIGRSDMTRLIRDFYAERDRKAQNPDFYAQFFLRSADLLSRRWFELFISGVQAEQKNLALDSTIGEWVMASDYPNARRIIEILSSDENPLPGCEGSVSDISPRQVMGAHNCDEIDAFVQVAKILHGPVYYTDALDMASMDPERMRVGQSSA